jgi:hypothetical protein
MNDDTGGGRPPRAGAVRAGPVRGAARAGALAAALSGLALLAAACSGAGPTAATGSASAQTPYQQALAYAQCMRTHGEPSFPDPTSQGLITFGPVDIHSPRYLSANKACAHLIPSQPLTAAQRREHVSQALKFSACMRSHGIANFPDPIVTRGGAAVGLRLSGIDQGSPQFQSAQHACRQFEPGLGGGVAP